MTDADDFKGVFGDPPDSTRRNPRDSLLLVGKHAKETAVAVGKLDLDEVLKTALFEMNGREAVLAYLLTEALGQIKVLESKVSLLLATASCLVDDVTELKGDAPIEENEKEESK